MLAMEFACPIEQLQAAATYRSEKHCLTNSVQWAIVALGVAAGWGTLDLAEGTHRARGVLALAMIPWFLIELILLSIKPTARGMASLGIAQLVLSAALLLLYFFPFFPTASNDLLEIERAGGCMWLVLGMVGVLCGFSTLTYGRARAKKLGPEPPNEVLREVERISRDILTAKFASSPDLIAAADGSFRAKLGPDIAVFVVKRHALVAFIPKAEVRYWLRGTSPLRGLQRITFRTGRSHVALGDESFRRLHEWKLPEEDTGGGG